MGIFADWQPRYAAHGIATFPVLLDGDQKKPCVRGYKKTGLRGSGQLARKFPEADAFAFMAGQRSGVTVLDIDAPDEDLLRVMLRRCGDTPVISRTRSGGFHCFYANNREDRKIRPDPDCPVDVLGGGMVTAAPSQSGGKRYELIRGRLDDLRRLPPIREGAIPRAERDKAQKGKRNDRLWRYLMEQARHVDTLEDLLDVARTWNHDLPEPLPDTEVVNAAQSAWGYQADGKNFIGIRKPQFSQDDALMDHLSDQPEAHYLYLMLRRFHAARKEFVIAPQAMSEAGSPPWSRHRIARARDVLIERGLIEVVREPRKGGEPGRYRLRKEMSDSDIITIHPPLSSPAL